MKSWRLLSVVYASAFKPNLALLGMLKRRLPNPYWSRNSLNHEGKLFNRAFTGKFFILFCHKRRPYLKARMTKAIMLTPNRRYGFLHDSSFACRILVKRGASVRPLINIFVSKIIMRPAPVRPPSIRRPSQIRCHWATRTERPTSRGKGRYSA